MKNFSTIIFVIILVSFSGCAETKDFSTTEKETMDSWLGSSKVSLLQSWGPPIRTTSDGQGGEILVYERTASFNGMVLTRQRNFYVNKDGKIYHYLCQGRQGY